MHLQARRLLSSSGELLDLPSASARQALRFVRAKSSCLHPLTVALRGLHSDVEFLDPSLRIDQPRVQARVVCVQPVKHNQIR